MIEIDLQQERGSAKEHSLTLKERQILEKELKNKDRIIYIVGSYAGLRVTEIAQCRFSWFEYILVGDKKVLAVNIPSKDRDSRNKYKLFQTKNRTARTTYIFDLELATEVYAYYKYNSEGLLISRERIWQRIKTWNKYLARENNNIHPHALRSTAQNIWKFELGHDDTFIQLCFGWKDFNTMVSHYRTMNKASGESYLIGKLK